MITTRIVSLAMHMMNLHMIMIISDIHDHFAVACDTLRYTWCIHIIIFDNLENSTLTLLTHIMFVGLHTEPAKAAFK